MNKDTIKNLTPSAARLLLVFITGTGDEFIDELCERAGIRGYDTYQKALKQLEEQDWLAHEGDKWFIDLKETRVSSKG